MWLVTDYHPNGSLYDYLNRDAIVRPRDALEMLVTVAKGIDYLHNEINTGTGQVRVVAV